MADYTKIHGCKEKCLNLYKTGLSTGNIAKRLGITQKTAYWHISKAGIMRRNKGNKKHTVNEGAFDRWTNESAYWLGFLLCDGSIPKTKNRYRLQLAIQQRDLQHLKAFVKFIGSSKRPYLYVYKTPFCQRGSKMCKVTIDNKHIVKRLIELGWRTFKDGYPINIPNKFWWPFFRGLIDGDGMIFILNLKQGKRLCLGYCNKHKQIVEWVRSEIYKRGFTNPKLRTTDTVPVVQWQGLYNLNKILSKMYKDNCPYLKRKYTTYKKLY